MRYVGTAVLLALLACREQKPKQDAAPTPPPPPAPSAGKPFRVNRCGDKPCEIVRGDPLKIATDGKSLFYTGTYALDKYGFVEVPAASADGRVVGTTDDEPNAMAADSDALYWTYSGSRGRDRRDGRINRMNRKTGAVVVLAPDLTFPYAIALDDTHVYWFVSDEKNPGVRRVRKTGGAVEKLAKVEASGPIAVTKTHVYYHSTYTDHGTFRVPKTGGEPAEISKDHIEFACDGDTLYGLFARNGQQEELLRIGPDGKIVWLGRLGDDSWMGPLAVDDRRVYVGEPGSKRLLAVPKTGGTMETFVSDAGPVTKIVVAGDYLFWTTGSQIGRVRRSWLD